MFLPGNYAQVLVESTVGMGLAGGGILWDIPTDKIPFHLRRIGSRFVVVSTTLSGRLEAETMAAEEIRSTLNVAVEEITDE